MPIGSHPKKNSRDDNYFRVLRLLEKKPDLTQRQLASELSVSVGAINYCLRALVERGWIKIQNFGQSDKKFSYAYILTPQGFAEKARLARSFLSRKVQEYEALKVEIEAIENEFVSTDLTASQVPRGVSTDFP